MTKKLPSDQDIVRRTPGFAESVDLALNSHRKTAKITVRDKLRLVNDELIKFKDSGISYRIICALLADKLGIHVSQQTLRDHCQEDLGFSKRATAKTSGKKTAQLTAQANKKVLSKHQPIIDERGTGRVGGAVRSHSTVSVKNQITEQTNKVFSALEDY